MADADSSFTHATDSLIALYRTVERRMVDLPLLSVMPVLIYLWEVLKFFFFLTVNLFIIPVNVVILIRNVFPGPLEIPAVFFASALLHVALGLARRGPYGPPYIRSSAFQRLCEGTF
jgi:hypothetical protein